MPEKMESGLAAIKDKMMTLEEKGALRGQLSTEEAFRKIKLVNSIRECIKEAAYIQVIIVAVGKINKVMQL